MERKVKREDTHRWGFDGIFRVLEGINNDDRHGMGDRIFPGCKVIERRYATEHFAS
jgi:hypothetical protein